MEPIVAVIVIFVLLFILLAVAISCIKIVPQSN